MSKVLIGLLGLCSIVLLICVVNAGCDQQAREEQAVRENLAFLDSLTVIMNEQARLQEITLQKQDSIMTDLRTMNAR